MPNWAYNRIVAKTRQDFERLRDGFVDPGTGCLDFNRIVPMPETVRHTTGVGGVDHLRMVAYALAHRPGVTASDLGTRDGVLRVIGKAVPDCADGVECLDDRIVDAIIDAASDMDGLEHERKQWDFRTPDDMKAASYAQEGMNCLENMLRYGVMDWYGWSTRTWGTKWNACETQVDKASLSIRWDTAWSPTIDMARLMSCACDGPCYYQYAEEQFTEYAGEFVFDRGDVLESSEEPGGLEQFVLAAELIDPEQDGVRYDARTGEAIFGFDLEEEQLERFHDEYPAVSLGTAMRRHFDAMGRTI